MLVFRNAALAAVAVLGACSGATEPRLGPPASIAVSVGDAQTAVAGSPVPTPPSVKVLDSRGAPVPNATVTFAVTAGGGSVAPASATTDVNGIATAVGWTLGTTAGTNTLTASIGTLTATFTATATAGAVASIAPVTGAIQSTTVNTNVAVAPAVILKDAHGNPVANVAVTFAVGTSGGTVTGGSQTTNAQGIATVSGWTVGQKTGSYSLIATSGTLTTTFAATALAGPPRTVLAIAGNEQVAPANSPVIVSPSVVVRDAYDNAVPDASVTFSVGASGGTITGATQITDAEGVATVGSWTLGEAGGHSLLASSGAASTAFAATAIAPATGGALRFRSISSGVLAQGSGSGHSCALDVDGRAWCWGDNGKGQLGDGTTVARPAPVRVSGSLTFVVLTGGWSHTCGLTSAGAAYCWGDHVVTQSLTPVAVGGGLKFKSLAAGGGKTCGLTSDGKAYCWGSNFLGGLGDGTQNNRRDPVAVAGGLAFASLSSGGVHTCGITTSGKAYCWGGGSPYTGVLGDGSPTVPNPRPADDPLWVRFRATPTEVVGGITFGQISAGYYATCALDVTGKAYCWGSNSWGAAGGEGGDRAIPVLVSGGFTFVSISTSGYHTCGRLSSGVALCWGLNSDGQFGNGQTGTSSAPVNAASGLTLSSIAVGFYHTCGLDREGKIYCWGKNDFGQLGDGTTTRRTAPTAVVFP